MGTGWGVGPWDDIPDALREPLHALVSAGEVSGRRPDGAELARILGEIEEYMWENHTCISAETKGSRNPESPNFGPEEQCERLAAVGSEHCDKHQDGE